MAARAVSTIDVAAGYYAAVTKTVTRPLQKPLLGRRPAVTSTRGHEHRLASMCVSETRGRRITSSCPSTRVLRHEREQFADWMAHTVEWQLESYDKRGAAGEPEVGAKRMKTLLRDDEQ